METPIPRSKVLVYSQEPLWKCGLQMPPRPPHEVVANPKDLLLFLADHCDVVALVVVLSGKSEGDGKVVGLVRHLNPHIPVVMVGPKKDFDALPNTITGPNLEWAHDSESLAAVLRPAENRRKFYRLVWPLTVHHAPQFNMRNHREGKVITLSAGGASVFTHDISSLLMGQDIFLRVLFEDFVFFVEAQVVRLSTGGGPGAEPGFAAAFKKITPATHGILKDVLKDQMVQTLSREFTLPV